MVVSPRQGQTPSVPAQRQSELLVSFKNEGLIAPLLDAALASKLGTLITGVAHLMV